MALRCLSTLLQYSEEHIALQVHDDGTLTSEDVASLKQRLDAGVLTRAEADQRMSELEIRYPAAALFRKSNPLALKLLDLALLGDEVDVAYCDSDVLFLRPFKGLFDLPENASAFFMGDDQNSFSVRSWDLLRYPSLRLVARLNSGLFVVRRRAIDLDLAEWFFQQPGFRFAPVWVEQTCWALLAHRAGARLMAPQQVMIPRRGESDDAAVALHFVSPVRDLLESHVDATEIDRLDGPAVTIESVASAGLTAAALAWTEARRLQRRLFG
jgi:hypothetical protein